MSVTTRANRGPSAAAENRAALLGSAREVLAVRGARAPLSAVAQHAGVSQAVLYRHFPSREALAFALFDQNMAEVEELARRDDSTLRDVTDLITHQIEGAAEVIELFAADEDEPRQRALDVRIRGALEPVLARAAAAREVRPDLSLDELLLAVGVIAATAARTPPDRRHDRVSAAWALLMSGMGPR